MPAKQPDIEPAPEPNSYKSSEGGGQAPPDNSEIDTFSRNDREGRPGPDERPDEGAIAAGEEGGYATDTFSRNDAEGLPGIEVGDGEGRGASSASAKPDAAAVRRVVDDPDTRDARPPSADGGGVR